MLAVVLSTSAARAEPRKRGKGMIVAGATLCAVTGLALAVHLTGLGIAFDHRNDDSGDSEAFGLDLALFSLPFVLAFPGAGVPLVVIGDRQQAEASRVSLAPGSLTVSF